MLVKIPRAYIEAMPANLLEGKVKLTFSISLNAETMQLREQLAMLKVLDQAVTLDITSPQGTLPATTPPDTSNNITADGIGEGDLGNRMFGQMVTELEAYQQPKSPSQRAQRERVRRSTKHAGTVEILPNSGMVTLSSGNKSVTMTNAQFSKAAQRIKSEGRAAARTKKPARTRAKNK